MDAPTEDTRTMQEAIDEVKQLPAATVGSLLDSLNNWLVREPPMNIEPYLKQPRPTRDTRIKLVKSNGYGDVIFSTYNDEDDVLVLNQ